MTATPIPAAPLAERAWVEQIMGMPISVHVRGPERPGDAADAAVRAVFDELRWVDATFSPYREESELRRLQRGRLTLEQCDPTMTQVQQLCLTARERTDGYFDAWACSDLGPGVFDPTGLVKTWAVARAARHLRGAGLDDFALNAGGDILFATADDAPAWQVGIEDPADTSRMLATVPIRDGAIATSGRAARGAHIVNPKTGERDSVLAAATVVGPSLLWADVFATAAIARGDSAREWVEGLAGTSGLLVWADGATHAWGNAT
jgi:thiamine biosynthesis lipoprotein